jgi:DNA polymerase III subunit alpha
MEYFAGYGFNKSHSTAYAFLAYQTAWLKANYPWHFAAALLTIEAQNTDKLAMYLAECRERQIPVLPPDLNQSQLRFSVEPGAGVRFGLTAIKGLGDGAVNAILEARRHLGGRIPSLHALCETLDLRVVNKRVFEALVKSGACDDLAPGLATQAGQTPAADTGIARRTARARLFAAIDGACDHGSRTQRDRDLGQADLFLGAGSDGGPVVFALPDVPPWSEIEQLNYEKETLGLYWSGHPIDRYADDLRASGARPIAALVVRREAAPVDEDEEAGGGAATAPVPVPPPGRVAEEVLIGGIVSGLRMLKTRKGDRMCVFMLDDAGGSLEVVVFPETFRQHGHEAENGRMVVVKGRSSATTSRPACWRPRSHPSRSCASGSRARWPSACRRRRTTGPPSRSSGTCWRGTRATGASRSSSTSAPAGCGSPPTSAGSACAPPKASSPTWRASAGAGRSACADRPRPRDRGGRDLGCHRRRRS